MSGNIIIHKRAGSAGPIYEAKGADVATLARELGLTSVPEYALYTYLAILKNKGFTVTINRREG